MTVNYEIGKPRQDGKMRVTLLVCIGDTKKRVKTELFAHQTDINRKGRLKSDSIIYNKVREHIINLEREYAKQETFLTGEKMSASTFLQRMTHSDVPTFFTFADQWIERANMKGKKNYKTALKKFKTFLKDSDIHFSMFSHKLLNDFMYALRDYPRAQSQYLSAIKKIYTDAEKDYTITPFALFRFDVPKQKKVGQRALDIETLRMIFNYQGNGVRATLARDCCMLSFAFCGINSVDLYEAPRIKENRLCYDRQKTKDRRYDNAHMEIDILPQVRNVVRKYKDTTRAFTFYKRFSTANNFNVAINKGLKTIHDELEKEMKRSLPKLNFYAIRHTWASIARNELKIEKSVIHEALAHIERDTAIDDIYIKKDYRLINEANRRVVDYLFRTDDCHQQNG